MKKVTKPGGAIKPAPEGSVTKQSAAKPKATEKPSTSTFMKKASKPDSAPKPAPTRPATNPLAAKSKAMAKSSTKPKPREVQDQAELVQVVAQLAMSAEKLAQAADRLTEATARLAGEQQDDTPKTVEELSAQSTPPEPVANGDSTVSEQETAADDSTEDG